MDADNMEATVETVLRVLDNKITRSYYTIKPIPSKNPVKPLLIIFKQEELRNALIQKRKEIALDAEMCGLGSAGNRKIYLNPVLRRHERELFIKARELKSSGFRYVWCKNGSVFARKKDGDTIINIVTAAQVDSLRNSRHKS